MNNNDQLPDLEEIIKKFFRNLFGTKSTGPSLPPETPESAPFTLSAGAVVSFIVLIVLAWLASGAYIVKEGQVAVVTQFGRYIKTVPAGFQWHIPYPIQQITKVDVARVRSFNVGYRHNTRNKNLDESLMLTEDENIVDVQFDVQYRLKPSLGTSTQWSPAAAYLFSTVDPDQTVRQAAESAMREVVGKESMNKILYESRVQAANQVKQLMQSILDRYHTGIEITSVAIQNVQPPEQVQAAFEDAVKAGQDNEKQKNEGNAYASKVVPEAQGQAARIVQDAEGYSAKVIAQAKGDTARFNSIEAQYHKYPDITRKRMYLSTMEQVFANTPKVLLDTQNKNNILYLSSPQQATPPIPQKGVISSVIKTGE